MIDLRDFYNNLNAGYRARSANNFRWAAIYACVATLIDGLYATHGYIDIQNQSINYFIAKGFLLLTAFIFLRQIKPSGAQDIQALILLLLWPCQDYASPFIKSLLPVYVFAGRWSKPTRLLSLIPIFFICFGVPWTLFLGCNIAATPTKHGAKLIDTASGIYRLYTYDSYCRGRTYALFREVEVITGVSFVKLLDYGQYRYKPILQRTPDNEIIIVPNPKENHYYTAS